ncbi:phage holin family protein [Arthrobacter castelli]|uniref:phage holin family protein n=1 Tax=Arthrobacter castelli TaxID=271431 RepID=UPI00056BB01F|nr:phage holin family protein [Arthrobacter castelli]
MVESNGSHSSGVNRNSSVTALAKLAGRLTPQQFKDELAIAMDELKRKGKQAAFASAFFVVALIFGAFLVIALIAAAILGLATVMPAWLAALIVAAAFLVIAAIAALIGLSRFKKVMPPAPESAIRGVQYDIGVLKEGSSFDPKSIEEKKARAKQEKAAKKEAEAKAKAKQPPPPSIGELKHRSQLRRDRLAAIRDSLEEKLDLKARMREASDEAKIKASSYANRSPQDTVNALKSRWQPLAVLAVSGVALAVFARKLIRR